MSIKKRHEKDYLELKEYLKDKEKSMSDYLMHCWNTGVRFEDDF